MARPKSIENKAQDIPVICVLDDKKNEVNWIIEHLNSHTRCKAVYYSSSAAVLDTFKKSLEAKVLILDLHMPGTDGIQTARMVQSARPDVKCISLSHCYEEPSIQERLSEDLRKYRSPFERYWSKDDLADAQKMELFAREVEQLATQHSHEGVVDELHETSGQVLIKGLDGQLHPRVFDREFLEDAGVTGVSQKVSVSFFRLADSSGAYAGVKMWRPGSARLETAFDVKKHIEDTLDREAVREKLG